MYFHRTFASVCTKRKKSYKSRQKGNLLFFKSIIRFLKEILIPYLSSDWVEVLPVRRAVTLAEEQAEVLEVRVSLSVLVAISSVDLPP